MATASGSNGTSVGSGEVPSTCIARPRKSPHTDGDSRRGAGDDRPDKRQSPGSSGVARAWARRWCDASECGKRSAPPQPATHDERLLGYRGPGQAPTLVGPVRARGLRSRTWSQKSPLLAPPSPPSSAALRVLDDEPPHAATTRPPATIATASQPNRLFFTEPSFAAFTHPGGPAIPATQTDSACAQPSGIPRELRNSS